jgi:RimJ/RimL family protein N-acetyltransferase
MNQNPQSHDVELRVPVTSDLPFIQWLWSDPETMKAVDGPFYISDDQAQCWLTAMIDPGQPTNCYRLIFNTKKEPVGEISFHQLNPNTMTAELNIKIASANRGKGYAKKALIQFLDYFFNQLGGRVMLDDVALDNDAGQNLLLRFGFEHDPGIDNVFKLFMTRERYHRLHTVQGLS